MVVERQSGSVGDRPEPLGYSTSGIWRCGNARRNSPQHFWEDRMVVLERLKKSCSQFGTRIFWLWRGFGERAGLNNPATEPKRSQSPKRPLRFPAFHERRSSGREAAFSEFTRSER